MCKCIKSNNLLRTYQLTIADELVFSSTLVAITAFCLLSVFGHFTDAKLKGEKENKNWLFSDDVLLKILGK